MREALFYILSSFWAGAVHAATPGHGKTIAAAYIVGARGKPSDAVVLGIFVTLSHVSGIVLVGVLASLGSTWLVPQRNNPRILPNGSSSGRLPPRPIMVQTWIIAGGATVPGCPAAVAAASST